MTHPTTRSASSRGSSGHRRHQNPTARAVPGNFGVDGGDDAVGDDRGESCGEIGAFLGGVGEIAEEIGEEGGR